MVVEAVSSDPASPPAESSAGSLAGLIFHD